MDLTLCAATRRELPVDKINYENIKRKAVFSLFDCFPFTEKGEVFLYPVAYRALALLFLAPVPV